MKHTFSKIILKLMYHQGSSNYRIGAAERNLQIKEVITEYVRGADLK